MSNEGPIASPSLQGAPQVPRSAYPDQPGVYLMREQGGEVIYVGKAKSLRKRISSYFSGEKDIKTRMLVCNVADIDVIVTANEQEALLLENTLIKRHKPRFNINLKDGKTYPVIKVSNEEFPRVYRTRRIVFDGSSYYGPYPRASEIDTYLQLINRLFPLRKCAGPLKSRDKPCLNFHIGRCSAPCAGRIGPAEYRDRVEQVRKLLAGRSAELLQELKGRMAAAAARREYERAARCRDQIEAVRSISETQKVVDFTEEDRDYIGWAYRDSEYVFAVMQMRGGKLVGRELFQIAGESEPLGVLEQFVEQYYTQVQSRPREVYLPASLEGTHVEEQLREEWGVRLKRPHRGRHAQTVALAGQNATETLSRRSYEQRRVHALEELQRALSLPTVPQRIEGFDVSHLDGEHTVASLVSFRDGQPDKKNYRTFRIRTLQGKVDDYEALREAIARRYTRVVAQEMERADLILVDGGSGQVAAAAGILKALELEGLPVVGLAKQEETIHGPGGLELKLDRSAEALRLLIAVRDESHRFANSLRKKLAQKKLETSVFEGIPGIGPKRARRLVEAFGTPQSVLKHSAEEVAAATGLTVGGAMKVLAHLELRHSTGTETEAASPHPSVRTGSGRRSQRSAR